MNCPKCNGKMRTANGEKWKLLGNVFDGMTAVFGMGIWDVKVYCRECGWTGCLGASFGLKLILCIVAAIPLVVLLISLGFELHLAAIIFLFILALVASVSLFKFLLFTFGKVHVKNGS